MAFLNGLMSAGSFGYYDISVSAPSGDLWATLILNVFNFITNYGWRVVLFTFILKILLSPADIFQKISMRKQQKVQAKLAPVFEKIDKQFAHDQRTAMQKKQEMQKKMGAGINPLVSCLPTILTLVIFITLFNSLQNIGAYKNLTQYVDLYNEYQNITHCVEVDLAKDDIVYGPYLIKTGIPQDPGAEATEQEKKAYLDNLAKYNERSEEYEKYYVKGLEKYVSSLVSTEENPNAIKEAYELVDINEYKDAKDFVLTHVYKPQDPTNPAEDEKIELRAFSTFVGQEAVYKLYGETMEGFLWIKNIWAVDAMWTAPVNDYTTFSTNIRHNVNSGTSCGCNCTCNCTPPIEENMSFNKELVDFWKEKDPDAVNTLKKAEKEALLGKEMYGNVVGALRKDDYYSTANGYLILPLLSIALALVNQIVTSIQQKRSGQQLNGQSGLTMKIMMWTMPVMIGFFAFMNVAAFALYLVVSYLVTLLVSLVMMFIYHIMDKKMDDDDFVHTYGRPNFNKRSE